MPRDHRRLPTLAILTLAALAALAAAPADPPDAAPPPATEPAAPTAPPSADARAAAINDARATLEQYVEVRRTISRERLQLAEGRQVLQDRLDLVQREIDSIKEKIADADKNLAAADEKRVELERRAAALRAASQSLADLIVPLEARTKALLARLPEPIRERIRPLTQRLPEDPATTRLSIGDRFLNVVGILNEVNKFNGEITLASEVRQLPDGRSIEVTSMYLGVGQGFYVNADGTIAGIGAPTADAWTWRSANDAAPALARAVAMMKNEQIAEFVPLPMRVD